MPLIHDRIDVSIDAHIAHVRFARPDKMNALDSKMFVAIPVVGKLLREDQSIRCVVISGHGNNFCAGLDKSNFDLLSSGDETANLDLSVRTHGIANLAQYAAWMWRELPMPVIAAIEGMALGGGLQIALGADIRIAETNSKFSILELKWGIIPDMSSTQVMRHLVRDDVIRELTYTARLFSAQEAKEWGFISHISEDPIAHALALAAEIVQKNPQAIRGAKKVIGESYYQSPAEGLLNESVEQMKVMRQPNQLEAVMSVLQRRAPNFKD